MDTALYYIYAYIDPNTLLPFYIGKGSKNRAHSHLKETKDSTTNIIKFYKIQKLLRLNTPPIIEYWLQTGDENFAYDIEASLITYYGRRNIDGGILTNICIDNRPPGMKGKKHSEETKILISEKLKGRKSPMYGKHHTDETKQILRTIALCRDSNFLSEEGRKRIGHSSALRNFGTGNPMYGKHHTEETKNKIGEKAKHRLSISTHPMLGKHHTRETRQRMSDAQKNRTLNGGENGRSKIWKLLTQENDTIEVKSLLKFCNKHNLAYDTLKRTLNTGKVVQKGRSVGWMVLSVN